MRSLCHRTTHLTTPKHIIGLKEKTSETNGYAKLCVYTVFKFIYLMLCLVCTHIYTYNIFIYYILNFMIGSWSWSHGSWIYNYLYNQWLSPKKLCQFESRSWRGVLYTSFCDTVFQWLTAVQLFSPNTLISSSNKTKRLNITEIVLKVAFKTITVTLAVFIDKACNIMSISLCILRYWHLY